MLIYLFTLFNWSFCIKWRKVIIFAVKFHNQKIMAVILNIDTSTTVCSAALTAEGMVLKHYEDFNGQNHASVLSDFIKGCLDFAADKEIAIEAVAVSMGPGSYTGLRIGLSEAKGLCYSLDIPLIGIDTLKLMATSAMFSGENIPDDCIFLPMIDARRMEVYAAAYDLGLNTLFSPAPVILDEDSFASLIATKRPIFVFGNGSEKAKAVLQADNVIFVPGINPLAVDMLPLSELAYLKREFIDVAYSTPMYLKEFQATKPKKNIATSQQ